MRRPKRSSFIRHIICLAMCAFLLQPIAAEAAETSDPRIQEAYDMGAMVGALDTTQKGSIEINEKYGSGITYSLYQIATFTEDGHGYYTEQFYKYKSDLAIAPMDAETSAEIEQLAESFVSIVENNGLEADAVDETNASGKVTFSGLTPGYYLVIAKSFTNEEGLVYSANPILVSVPGSGENESFQIVIESKSELTKPETPTTPDTPTTEKTTTTTSKKSKGTLPQTGLLWWPIPVLAVAGMLFYLLGYVLEMRSNRRENEAR